MPTTPQPAAGTRTSTLILLALAAAVRLLAVFLVLTRYPKGWLFTRGIEMTLLARNVLAGHGLSSPFGPPTGPTAFIAPGYPLFVAAVFKIFGIETTASAFVIMLLHVAANIVTIALIMRLARRLFHQQAALIAGVLWAFSPPLILLPTIFWDTSFAICLLTWLVWFVLEFAGDTGRVVSRRNWIFLGVYCALTALLTPALLFVLVLVFSWLLWQQRKHSLTAPLFAVLAFAVVFSPWPLRNDRVFHAFIPLRTTVGFELWMGNHDGANGYLMESLFPMYNSSELAQYNQMGEVAYTEQKSALAKQYIATYPKLFAKMTLRRALRFWTGTGTQNGSPFFALHATLTSVLGLIGLWMAYRRGHPALAALFALVFLFFPVPYYITHAEFRYRLIIDPLLTVFASGVITLLLAEPTQLQKPSTPQGL